MLSAADPGLVCVDDDPALLVVDGAHLDLVLADALTERPSLQAPRVRLVAAGPLVEGGVAPETGRYPIPPHRVAWVDAGRLEVGLDASLELTSGAYDLEVLRADGIMATLPRGVAVAGPPVVLGVEPEGVCVDLDAAPLRLTGTGFLVVDGVYPTVRVGEDEIVATGAEGCVDLLPPAQGALCEVLEVPIDPSRLGLGEPGVRVTNPSTVGCTSRESANFQVLTAPELLGVAPEAVCASGDAGLWLTGRSFVNGTQVSIGGVPAAAVQVIDDRTMHVLPAPTTPEGVHDVEISLPYGCSAMLEQAVRVVSRPVIFHLDPPAVLAGVALDVTLYVADLVGELTDVWLEDPQGVRVDVDWWWDPEEVGRVGMGVPPGLAGGDHVVRVAQDGGCVTDLAATLWVEDAPTVAVDLVAPRHAWSYTITAVDVRGLELPQPPLVGFQATPRVFLVGPDGAPASYGLIGVAFKGDALLSGLVPYNLPSGDYDVLVINPDRTVGVLPAGLTVLRAPPPTIETVGPATVPNQTNQTITVRGRDFRDPAVALVCRESGVITRVTGTVSAASYSTITVQVSPTAFNRAVCVVEVVNADGTEAAWSALSVTNPAQNLFPWRAGTQMVEARRATAAAAGRTTSVDRFVYAIGGDAGARASAKDTVEVAPVGVYGDIGAWQVLRGRLPSPRTHAVAVTIDRFVYLFGGHDGAQAVDSVLRAHILSPTQVPLFEGLSIRSGEGTGLAGGAWTYRVSALFGPGHPTNPEGESLAGAPTTVSLPDTVDGLRPELRWIGVPGAVGYRVYRTPQSDLPTGSEEWLADVVDPSFLDVGDDTVSGVHPQPLGALGTWIELPSMMTPREAPCVATVREPLPDRERRYVYVAGGRNAAGTVLSSIEILPILIETATAQLPEGWTASARSLTEARHQCGGYSLDDRLNSAIPSGDTWLYFAGGLKSDGSATGVIDAGRVQDQADFEAWTTIRTLSPRRAGFGYAAASNFLYVFGGNGGSPSSGGVSGRLDVVPDVQNWNGLGTSLSESRYLPGAAQESAVIFILGGQTDALDATRTTDFTNY